MGAERSREQGGGLLLALGNWLVLLSLLFGGLEAFLSSQFYVYDRGALLALCALFSALSAGLYAWRHSGWAALGILAVLALAARPLWERWLEPAVDMFRFAGMRSASLPLLTLLTGGLALLLGWLVVRARCWYLCAAVVILPLVPAILEGVLPAWTALLLSTAGWGALLLTALFNSRDARRLGRAQLCSLAGMGAFLALLSAVLPQEGYERPQWATDTRDRLVEATANGFSQVLDWDIPAGDLVLDISGGLRPGQTAAANPGLRSGLAGGAGSAVVDGRVDLLAAGPRSYVRRTIMTLRTDQPDPEGPAYLFGGSAAVYTGSSWETAPDYPGYTSLGVLGASLQGDESLSPALFPAGTAPDVPVSSMTVRLAFGGGTLFLPYRLDQAPPTSPGQEYTLAYRPGGPEDGFVPLEGLLAQAEEDYRAYVYANYLDVPARTQGALLPVLRDMEQEGNAEADSRLPEAHREAAAAAARTARYLAGHGVYDLTVDPMEPGEDFVEHFLELGRGYCVHFATTGALLLRMQGIPARYASGYVARLDSDGRASVQDSSAHAWVEIYLDGYGWYPVEMTPGAADSGEDAGAEDTAGSPAESQMQTPERPQAPQVPQTPADSAAPDQTEPEAPPAEPEVGGGDSPAVRESVDLTWLWRALAVLSLPAAAAGLYRLALEGRKRARMGGDTNRSVIAAYGRYRRLLAWGCGEDALLEELARKSKFSQHTLTGEERAAAWDRLEALTDQTAAALPAWKRWVLRLLRPVL